MQKFTQQIRITLLLLISSIALLQIGCTEIAKKTAERQKYLIPDSILKKMVIDTVKECP